jgi:ubiquinone biosynthesis protein COQ9
MSDRDDILQAALHNVAFDGWSERALHQGAQDVGATPEAVARVFPRGVADLVEAFSEWADRTMIEALAARDVSELRTREKVALAVRLRLEALQPHREAVRRLNSYFTLPLNGLQAARLVARTVDAIWYAAGDRATDFSYYTKRGLLAAAYGATVLYWLADESDGQGATWTFLERRLDDILRLPRLRGELQGVLNRLPNPARAARLARRRSRFRL